MTTQLTQSPLKAALILGGLSMIGLGLVTGVFHLTQKTILANQQAARLALLQQLLTNTVYDNNLLKHRVSIPLYDSKLLQLYYRIYHQQKPVAVIMPITTMAGYNGEIELLIAIKYNGELIGVRVVKHRETPGLGDKIELSKSLWILQFNQRSLLSPPIFQWTVKRQQGQFDQLSGATITSRAVIDTVKQGLIRYQLQQKQIWQFAYK
ncbi:MAG: Electron transport complex protein rnfG [Pseudomonadota bacterium]|jgi:electron transport complex protein RnfG